MKRILSSLILSLFVLISNAQTPLSGGIYQNTTWTKANSPYVITSPVVIFPNVTLTIEPGVKILVREQGNGTSAGTNYLEVRGRLQMVGTATDKIDFEGETQKTKVDGWYGIKIMRSQGATISADYFELSNAFYGFFVDTGTLPDSSVFNHCKWSYNNYAYNAVNYSIFNNCEFSNNLNGITGNLLATRSPWIVVNQSKFFNNGVGLNPYGSLAAVNNSLFQSNPMAVSGIGSIELQSDTFIQNQIAVRGISGKIEQSVFNNNPQGIIECSEIHIKNIQLNGSNLGIDMGERSILEQSVITNNVNAVQISSSLTFGSVYPVISQNRICFNSAYHVLNGSNLNLNLARNCFCERDSAAIDAKLFDGYDDITKGLFNFSVYDTTCSTVLEVIEKTYIAGTQLSTKDKVASVKLYPNPGNNFFTASSSLPIQQIRILDVTGKVVLSESNRETIYTESLKTGIYTVMIQTKTGTQALRWVKH